MVATASDDDSISRLELRQNGLLIASKTEAPFEFNVTGLAAGNYRFQVRAYDNLGLVSSDAVEVVMVDDSEPNQDPSVSITNPASDANFALGSVVTVDVTASDNDGVVTKVELRQDGVLVDTDAVAPYTFTLSNLQENYYNIEAKAYDDDGATRTDSILISLGTPANQGPIAAFESPTAPASIVAGSDLYVKVVASDPDGVKNVELYLDGALVRRESIPPYEWGANGQNDPLLQSMTVGNYLLEAVSLDKVGVESTISMALNVVSPPPPASIIDEVIEAESFDDQSGVVIMSGGSESVIGDIQAGDWALYSNLNFDGGVGRFEISLASATGVGSISLYLDAIAGDPLGTVMIPNTGSLDSYTTASIHLTTTVTEVHDLYLQFSGGSASLVNVDWLRFAEPAPVYTGTHQPEGEPSMEFLEEAFSIIYASPINSFVSPIPQVSFDLNAPWLSGSEYVRVYSLGLSDGFEFFRASSLTTMEEASVQFMRLELE